MVGLQMQSFISGIIFPHPFLNQEMFRNKIPDKEGKVGDKVVVGFPSSFFFF